MTAGFSFFISHPSFPSSLEQGNDDIFVFDVIVAIAAAVAVGSQRIGANPYAMGSKSSMSRNATTVLLPCNKNH